MSTIHFVQTPDELKQALLLAASETGGEQHLFCLGDAATEGCASQAVPDHCRLWRMEDLGLDLASLWEEAGAIQTTFWQSRPDETGPPLHLVFQWAVGETVFRIFFVHRIVRAAIERIRPQKAVVFSLASSAYEAIADLPWIVGQTAAFCGVPCRLAGARSHWPWWRCGRSLVEQALRDAAQRLLDLRAQGIVLPETPAAPLPGIPSAPILLVNAETDLARQFSFRDLPPALAERCFVWSERQGGVLPLPAFLAGPPCAGEASGPPADLIPWATFRQAGPRESASAWMARAPRDWFHSAASGASGTGLPHDLEKLLSCPAAAPLRLENWRRMAYTARLLVRGRAVLRALRPAAVVASDMVDVSRTLSLAARTMGIPVLATAHSLPLWRSQSLRVTPLGTVHAVLSTRHNHLRLETALGAPPPLLLGHDEERPAGEALSAQQKARSAGPALGVPARVLILTSLYSAVPMVSWVNSVLVETARHRSGLRELIQVLANAAQPVRVTIKCHPMTDDYVGYDQVAAEFPQVVERVWREPASLDTAVPAEVVVLFNCCSTLFLGLARQGVPVIAHWGALTEVGREMFPIGELLGSESSEQVAAQVGEVLAEPNGPTATAALEAVAALRDRIISPTRLTLEEAIQRTLTHAGARP